MRTRFKPLLVIAICAGSLVAACGGNGDGSSDSQPKDVAGDLPAGWQTFDKGAVRGAIPPGWQLVVLGRPEYLELVQQGADLAELSEAAKDTIGSLTGSDLSDSVLIAGEPDGFPNINVQPCFPDSEVVRPGAEAIDFTERYTASLGISAVVEGVVEYGGSEFALVKASFYPDLDTYQVFFGSESCASIATLTAEAGEEASVTIFQDFMAALQVEED